MPNTKILYTLRANHTGSRTRLFSTKPWRVTVNFTFDLTSYSLIEHVTDPGYRSIERHDVQLTKNHLIDDYHVYWGETGWIAQPMDITIDCRRP